MAKIGLLVFALVSALCVTSTRAATVNATQLEILREVALDWPVLNNLRDSTTWNGSNLENACNIGAVFGIAECDADGWVTKMSFEGVGLGVMSPSMANMSRLESLLLHGVVSGPVADTWGQLTSLKSLKLVGNSGLEGPIPDSWQGLTALEELIIQYSYTLGGSLPTWMNANWPDLKTLVLEAAGLTGMLPADLTVHPSLTTVRLSTNALIGSLPEDLATNPRFEVLVLDHNRFEGEIPSDWADATALATLDLSHNDFNGSLPTSFGPALSYAYFSYNLFSGNVLPSIFDAGQLIELALDNNTFTGAIPFPPSPSAPLHTYIAKNNDFSADLDSSLWQFQNLQAFDASNNMIPSTLPSDFDASCSLRFVDLSSNRLSGSIPSDIGQCSNLISLNLAHNQLDNAIPEGLAQIGALEELDLHDNRLNGELPDSWASLSHLYHLDLSHNAITGPLPFSLLNLTQSFLEDLYLNDNDFDLCGNAQLDDQSLEPGVVCSVENQQTHLPCDCYGVWARCLTQELEELCPSTTTPDADEPSIAPELVNAPPTSQSPTITEPVGGASGLFSSEGLYAVLVMSSLLVIAL